MKCKLCHDTGFIINLLDKPFFDGDGLLKDREYIRCSCGGYNWQFDKDRLGNMVYAFKKLSHKRKHEIEMLEYKLKDTVNLFDSACELLEDCAYTMSSGNTEESEIMAGAVENFLEKIM